MMDEWMDRKLKDFDDSFGITGDMLINLPGTDRAEVKKVFFCWKLSDSSDRYSMKDIALGLEGYLSQVAKILIAMDKTDLEPEGPEEAKSQDGMVGLLLSMNYGLTKEVVRWFREEPEIEIPPFLVGKERMEKVFDFSQYEVLSFEML